MYKPITNLAIAMVSLLLLHSSLTKANCYHEEVSIPAKSLCLAGVAGPYATHTSYKLYLIVVENIHFSVSMKFENGSKNKEEEDRLQSRNRNFAVSSLIKKANQVLELLIPPFFPILHYPILRFANLVLIRSIKAC